MKCTDGKFTAFIYDLALADYVMAHKLFLESKYLVSKWLSAKVDQYALERGFTKNTNKKWINNNGKLRFFVVFLVLRWESLIFADAFSWVFKCNILLLLLNMFYLLYQLEIMGSVT